MKKLFTLFSLLAFVFGINAQTNLVSNADFESGDAGWTNSGAVSRTIVTPGHESTQAFEVVGEINKGAQYIDGATVVTVDAYEVSFWAKGTVGEVAKLKVKFTDASSVVLSGTFAQSDVWEFFKYTYEQSEVKTIDKFILQCGSGTVESPMTFVADDLFYGVSTTGVDPIDPVTPEFTNFPFTEDFESTDYTIGAYIAKKNDVDGELDSWPNTDPKVYDRFWRGNNTTEYLASVDADANGGSKAMKLAITTLEAKDFRLRTVNIPEGNYTVTLMAKTDADGLGKAKLGFSDDESTWSSLTETYAEYSVNLEVVANPNNGTTRLIIFYTADKTVVGTQSYNLWIDDIEIKEMATAIGDTPTSETVTLYPNPASTLLFFKSADLIDKVEVYSLSGQKVLEVQDLVDGVDVAHLPNGIYIASIEVNGDKVIKKFTKK